MSRPDVKPLAAAERRDLADLLETLTPEQWQAQSLCAEWNVHQVATHVVSYEELSVPRALLRTVPARLRGLNPNDIMLAEYADRTPEQVVALLRHHLIPTGLTAGFGGAIALTDGMIHHQDIRRPLGLPREIPEERLVPALEMAKGAPLLPARGIRKGLRLVATDVEFGCGDGPEVTGPGEALLMAIAGRSASLGELTGEGASTLAERVRNL